jgi:hypothetical protein
MPHVDGKPEPGEGGWGVDPINRQKYDKSQILLSCNVDHTPTEQVW